MKCDFCNHSGLLPRTVIENDFAFAFLTNIPIVPGHMLIATKQHKRIYEEISGQEKEAIEELRLRLKEVLIKEFEAEGFNYAWNEGAVAGQSVLHFHLHMVPRREGDKGVHRYDPREFLYRSGDRSESSLKELALMNTKIRAHL